MHIFKYLPINTILNAVYFSYTKTTYLGEFRANDQPYYITDKIENIKKKYSLMFHRWSAQDASTAATLTELVIFLALILK